MLEIAWYHTSIMSNADLSCLSLWAGSGVGTSVCERFMATVVVHIMCRMIQDTGTCHARRSCRAAAQIRSRPKRTALQLRCHCPLSPPECAGWVVLRPCFTDSMASSPSCRLSSMMRKLVKPERHCKRNSEHL